MDQHCPPPSHPLQLDFAAFAAFATQTWPGPARAPRLLNPFFLLYLAAVYLLTEKKQCPLFFLVRFLHKAPTAISETWWRPLGV